MQGDIDREKQAVIDIQRATIGSQGYDAAFPALYDHKTDEVLVFFLVGACVAAEQYDTRVTRDVFFYDFTTYKDASEKTHTQGERWQNFNDPRLKIFVGCTNESRFHTVQQISN